MLPIMVSICLACIGSAMLTTAVSLHLGKPGIFISIEGEARLIRDKAQFERHWMSDLERWFPEGIDTPGLVLINVHGNRVQYWDGEENGVISV